jgi:ABC-type phosphate transport system auxiliary subunit
MPRNCTICRHERCAEIDRVLVDGEAFRNIAGRFGTSVAALHRHKKEHLPGKLAKAHEAREVAQADSLRDQVRHLADEAQEILENVKAAQPGTAVQAVRAALHALELQAKILGEIRAAQVNVGVGVGVPEKVLITVRQVDMQGKTLRETESEAPRETVYPQSMLPRGVNTPDSRNGTGPGRGGV